MSSPKKSVLVAPAASVRDSEGPRERQTYPYWYWKVYDDGEVYEGSAERKVTETGPDWLISTSASRDLKAFLVPHLNLQAEMYTPCLLEGEEVDRHDIRVHESHESFICRRCGMTFTPLTLEDDEVRDHVHQRPNRSDVR